MKEFKKYQHLERFGTDEVLNIQLGETYVFPKIDGTNASLWSDDGRLQAGSRNRHLSLDNDNAGFFNWAVEQQSIHKFFNYNPNLVLYGEWLIPHSLKTYRKEAWRNFYVFDVMDYEMDRYLSYKEYEPLLKKYGVEYIPPLSIINNGNYERFITHLDGNNYLIEDGKGNGEGIVIKNYDFKNKYGRTTWAKIVTSEFREKHNKEMGAPLVDGKPPVETIIVNEFVTLALCEKVLEKIRLDNDGFSSKNIPQLLNTIFYDLVREDCWNFVKKYKNPVVDFSALQHLTFKQIKQLLPQIFS